MKKGRKKKKMVRPIEKRVNGMEDSLKVKRDEISPFEEQSSHSLSYNLSEKRESRENRVDDPSFRETQPLSRTIVHHTGLDIRPLNSPYFA